jgi:hypothetical protein
MKKSKLALRRDAIRVLDNKQLASPAGGKPTNPFDDTIHSHWVPCDTHFQSRCFTTDSFAP